MSESKRTSFASLHWKDRILAMTNDIPVRRGFWILGLIFLGMLGAIGFGTWAGFPVFDDASLILLWQEKGPGTLAAENWHRPVCGLLLEGFVDTFGVSRMPYVFLNLAFWILLAWQTYKLSLRLLVGDQGTAALSTILVLSPILVRTHYTTVTTLFPANLPLSICLAVLLFSLRDNIETKPALIVIAALITTASAAISEYGVATAAASVLLLLAFHRRRAAIAILIGAVIGYFLFQSIGDFQLRPSRATSKQFEMLQQRPLSTVTHFLDSIWQSLIGAYGKSAGNISIKAGSLSTILSAFAGVVSAIVIIQIFRKQNVNLARDNSRKTMLGLALAIVGGLTPVILANQWPSSGDSYETRFFIPILPFAAILTAKSALHITTIRFKSWVAAIFTFVAVCAVCNGAFETRREQIRMEAVGDALQPLVRRNEGMTIVVVPDYEKLDGADITPKVTKNWPIDLVQRTWVLPSNQAIPLFGPRTQCRNTSWIDLKPGFWSTGRRGPVSNLAFVPQFWDETPEEFSPQRLESYCVNPVGH